MSLQCTSFALRTVGCWKAILTFSQHTAAKVTLLVGRSLDADVDVGFAGDGSRLVVADVAVKSFRFRLVAVYASSIAAERVSFFRRLAPFLDDTKRLVLIGDWNAILDPKINKAGRGASRLGRCESSLVGLVTRHDLVDRFRLDHPGREMWTWLDSSPTAKVGSYLDRVEGSYLDSEKSLHRFRLLSHVPLESVD